MQIVISIFVDVQHSVRHVGCRALVKFLSKVTAPFSYVVENFNEHKYVVESALSVHFTVIVERVSIQGSCENEGVLFRWTCLKLPKTLPRATVSMIRYVVCGANKTMQRVTCMCAGQAITKRLTNEGELRLFLMADLREKSTSILFQQPSTCERNLAKMLSY